MDCDSKSVWKRYRSTQASIDGVSPVMGGSSLENAVTTVCNYLGADYNAAAYMEQGYTAVQAMNMISGVHGISLTGITYEKALRLCRRRKSCDSKDRRRRIYNHYCI